MPSVTIGPFTLDAPPEWTLSTVILAGPVEDSAGDSLTADATPFQMNLVATMERVDDEVTAEDYVDRQVAGLRSVGVSRRGAKEAETVQLSDGEGLLTEQVIKGQTGERVRQMQLVAIKHGVAYTLICSHLDGPLFENSRATFRRMLLSFK